VVEVHVGEEHLLDVAGCHPDLAQHGLGRLPVVEAESVDPLLGVEPRVDQIVVARPVGVPAGDQHVDHR
jgi:hypothetical protein